MKTILIATVAAFILPASALAAGPCGSTVEVRRGDTLSSIAARCDVDEQDILRSNPGVHGSRDLRVGEAVSLSEKDATDRALDALGSATRRGAEALTGVAQDVKSSVSDLLDKNPDLKSRIDRLGKSISGAVSDKDRRGDVTAKVETGATGMGPVIRVTAEELPADKPVFIGIGSPRSAYDVVDHARTSSGGTLDVALTPPAWARDQAQLVAVVGGDAGGWTVRSPAFTFQER